MVKNILIVILVGFAAVFYFSRNKDSGMTPYKTDDSSMVQDVENKENAKEEAVEVNSRNSLDLSGKGLTKLPSDVLSNTSLEELDISNNNLTGALPAEIRQLQNLKVLDASDNQMTGVPAEVGQLRNLEVLDLSNNQLTGLPYELGNLKNLKVLDLSGNDYAQQDLDVIKQGLPADVQMIL